MMMGEVGGEVRMLSRGGGNFEQQYTVVTWNTQGVAGAGDETDGGRGILDMIAALRVKTDFGVLLIQEFSTNTNIREGEVGRWRFFIPPRADRFRSTAIIVNNSFLERVDSFEFRHFGGTAVLEVVHDNESLIFIASWAPHADLGIARFIDHWGAFGGELDRKVGQVIHFGMDANAVVPYR